MAENQLLVPLEEYLKAGIHIGTKFRTVDMKPFIYKIRPDGLSVLNVESIDKRLNIACNFMSQYEPNEILIVCRRENGWQAVSLMSELLGIKKIVGRYPPGIMTNIQLETFIEPKLVIVIDPWPDKNAVKDASRHGIPVIALCDTNNDSKEIDLLMPCNNKGKKSLGLVLWVLTKEYLKRRKIIEKDTDLKYTLEDFSRD